MCFSRENILPHVDLTIITTTTTTTTNNNNNNNNNDWSGSYFT